MRDNEIEIIDVERQKENKKKILLLLLLLLFCGIIIMGIIFGRQKFMNGTIESDLKNAAEEFINSENFAFNNDISIPASLLKEKHYLQDVDDACIDSSYVIVRKRNGDYQYEVKLICEASTYTSMSLNGDKNVVLEVGEEYIEKGVTVEGASSADVEIKNNVDTSKVGKYVVNYVLPKTDPTVPPAIRFVDVVDTTAPVITLKGSDVIYLGVGQNFVDPGAEATDNYDGDITTSIRTSGKVNTSVAGTYTITYSVTDAHNNKTSIKRTVIVKGQEKGKVPTLILKGYGTVYLDVNQPYYEAGYTASDSTDGNLTSKVKKSGTVNVSKVGTYVITYTVTNSLNETVTARRYVVVRDTVRPTIRLNGPKEITLEYGSSYNEQGATATDNYDGTLSVKRTGVFYPNKVGTYYLTYTAVDSSGNKASVTRTVKIIDTVKPTISLKGDEKVFVEVNSTWKDPFVEADDNYDKKNVKVITSGDFNIHVLGTYTITYTAKDTSGNTASVKRTVVVQDTTAPEIRLIGASSIELELGTPYQELGATVTDNYDTQIQDKLVIDASKVNINQIGTYQVTYNVMDINGNRATQVVREVVVKDTTGPEIVIDTDTLGRYVKEADVNVEITDANGSIALKQYQWGPKEIDSTKWASIVTQNLTYHATQGEIYLHIKAVDASGNEKVVTSGPYYIDTEAPTVRLTQNGGIFKTVQTTALITDSYSGVSLTYYAWKTELKEPTKEELQIYTPGTVLTQNVPGTYYLYIVAADAVGNKTTFVSNMFTVDNNRPNVVISSNTSSHITKENPSFDVTYQMAAGHTLKKIECAWTNRNQEPTEWQTGLCNESPTQTIQKADATDGTYYLWVRVTDSLDLVTTQVSTEITVDKTAPVLTVHSDDKEITKEVTIQVGVEELHRYTVYTAWTQHETPTEDEFEVWHEFATSNKTKHYAGLDGTYYFHVKVVDEAGNETETKSLHFTLDNTAPKAPEIVFDDVWTNKNVTVTITGEDNIYYSLDGIHYEPYKAPFEMTENGTIYAKSEDLAGNISTVTNKSVTKIEKVAPEITLTSSVSPLNGITVSYQVSDNLSGIAKIEYAWSNQNTTEPTYTNTTSDLTGTISKNDVTGDYYLWVKATDHAGNVTIQKTDKLSLDRTQPIIHIKDVPTNIVSQGSAKVEIIEDNISTIDYAWSTSTSTEDLSYTTWDVEDFKQNPILTTDNTFTDGTYYLHIRVIDEFGNIGTAVSEAMHILRSKPIVVFDPILPEYAKEVSASVTITLPTSVHLKQAKYYWSTSDTLDESAQFTEFDPSQQIHKTSGTGAYYLYIQVIDDVDGNRVTTVRSDGAYLLDNTEPLLTITPNGTTSPVSSISITLTGSDAHSGVKKIEYAWSTSKDVAPTLNQYKTYNNTFTYENEQNGTYYLWVKVVDNANNESIFTSEAYVIENEVPKITITPNSSNPTKKQEVDVMVEASTNYTVSYAWDTNPNATNSTNYQTWADYDATNHHKLNTPATDGTYYLHIKVTDANGSVVNSSAAFVIDGTGPVIVFEPTGSTVPKREHHILVKITDLSDYDVSYYWSTSKEEEDRYVVWNEYTSNDDAYLNLGTMGEADGTYYLHVKATDSANNTTVHVQQYVLRRTKPAAPTIQYDTNWTKESVPVTITGGEDLTFEYSFNNITWYPYNDAAKPLFTENQTTIYARAKDIATNVSDVVSATIVTIDKVADDFGFERNPDTFTNQNVTVSLDYVQEPESPLVIQKWAKGSKDETYFATQGTAITNNQFTVTENDVYTVYSVDSAGNAVIKEVTVSNIDKVAPTITFDEEKTLEVGQNTNFNVMNGVTVNDTGFGIESITVSPESLDTSVLGSHTLTYTAVDKAGNTTTVTRTVIVKNMTPPQIVFNNLSQFVIQVKTEKPKFDVTATDSAGNEVEVIITEDPKKPLNVNVIDEYTVTFSATDSNGNTTTITKTVYVLDSQAPQIIVGENENFVVNINTERTFDIKAIDNYDGEVPVTLSKDSVVDYTTYGNYPVVFEAVDSHGNKAVYPVTIHVRDTVKPVIHVDKTTFKVEVDIRPTAKFDPNSIIGATVTDNIDTDLTPIYDISSVKINQIGDYTVTINAKDSSENDAEPKTVTIQVRDTTPPHITIEDMDQFHIPVHTKELPQFKLVITDNYDQNLTYTIDTEKSDTVQLNVAGTYKLVFKVVDSSSNEATAEVTVHVEDNDAPVLDFSKEDFILKVNEPLRDFNVTATDNYDTNVRIEYTGTIDTTKVGEYKIVYTATDSEGNSTSKEVTVRVIDDGKPTIHIDKAEYTIQVHSTFDPTMIEYRVTDNYDTDLKATIDSSKVDTTKVGNYTVTLTAKDSSENEAESKTVTVHVVDTTAPVITVEDEAQFTVNVNSTLPQFRLKVTDNYDQTVSYTQQEKADQPIRMNVVGDYPIIFTAIDSNGNKTTLEKTVHVRDKEAPVIDISKDNFTLEVGSALRNFNVTATDNYDQTVTVTLPSSEAAKINTNVVGNYTVQFEAVDSSGNKATKQVTVRIVDTQKPVITIPTTVWTAEVNTAKPSFTATVTDNYDKNLRATITDTINMSKVGTYKVTYTAVDSNKNTTTIVKDFRVVDTTAPVLTLKGNTTMEVEYLSQYVEPSYTVSDNSKVTPKVTVSGSVNTSVIGTYTLTYTATDGSGNRKSATRTVKVVAANVGNRFINNNVTCVKGKDCYNLQDGNNYVWYSGYLWRAYKINSDNTVKLVMDEPISSFSYDGSSSTFHGSAVNKWLNKVFYPTLNNASQIVVNAPYCNETTTNASSRRTTCSQGAITYETVGLLTLDEYNWLDGNDGYLASNDKIFTMTPKVERGAWVIEGDANRVADTWTVRSTFAIRPVITIRANINAGTGTRTNPYSLVGDNRGSVNSLLSSRNEGEYVSFASKTWRILNTSNGTKLVLNSIIKTSTFGTTDQINSNNGIGQQLSNMVNTLIPNSADRNLLINSSWGYRTYNIGENPVDTTLNTTYLWTSKVGMLNIGELFATSQKDIGSAYWLMNPYVQNQAYYIQTNAVLNGQSISNTSGVRPVIHLNNNVRIKGGNGTKQSPYTIG